MSKKLFLSAIISFCMTVMTFGINSVSAEGTSLVYGIDSHKVIINGEEHETDAAPYLYPTDDGAITYAPLRYSTEAFGAEVIYDSVNNSAVVKYNEQEYVYDFLTKAQVVNDRSYIPLRDLMELLQMRVDWYDGLILISEADEELSEEQQTEYREILYAPYGSVSFSRAAGLYEDDFDLELSTELDGATIYYTTDGSDPTEDSAIYTEPIHIYDKTSEPAVISKYITTNSDYLPPTGDIMKGTVIKARAVKDSGAKTTISVSTYIVSPEIKSRYGTDVVCITTPKENLFDTQIGIYTPENCSKRGSEWERKAYMELFDHDGDCMVSQPVSIRINGGTTRMYQQKSLRVYAKKNADFTNGDRKKIEYPLFGDTLSDIDGNTIDKFDTIVLRNFGDDWLNFAMRDAVVSKICSPMNQDTLANKICVVFINGEYWGAHEIRERYDAEYFQSHYNLDSDKDVCVAEISDDRGRADLSDGEQTEVNDLNERFNFVAGNDMTIDENYEQAESVFDFDSLIDHYIANVFFENDDWPVNNVKMWKNTNPENPVDTKWHFTLADSDNTFVPLIEHLSYMNNTQDKTWWKQSKGGTLGYDIEASDGIFSKFMRSLMRNDEFREKFKERYMECLETYFTSENIKNTINEMWAERLPLRSEHIRRYRASWSKGSPRALLNYAEERPSIAEAELWDYLLGLDEDE